MGRRGKATPGQRVELALGATDVVRAEAVEPVGIGWKAARETSAEQQLAAIDPAAAYALLGTSPSAHRVTRQQAMRVPAVRRGRSLIAGTIGTLPLVCHRRTAAGYVEPVTRRLVTDLDPRTTPAYTLTWTVDDLIFHGVSWWRVIGRETVAGVPIGYPTAIERLAPGRVSIDPASGQPYVDGRPARDADLIRFDGPDDGVLADAHPTVPLALALANAGMMTADDEVPSVIFRPAEGAPELSNEPGTAGDGTRRSQVGKLLDDWHAARRQRRTAYLNRSIEAQQVAYDAKSRQLHELSALVSSELARLLNLPASRIGAPQGSGMTYTNTESDRRDLIDTTLSLYLTPIQQRLSMPDVTPHGQAVTWDLTGYLRGTTGELVSAGAAAVDAGFATPEEVRTRWLGLPPTDQLPRAVPGPDTPAAAGS